MVGKFPSPSRRERNMVGSQYQNFVNSDSEDDLEIESKSNNEEQIVGVRTKEDQDTSNPNLHVETQLSHDDGEPFEGSPLNDDSDEDEDEEYTIQLTDDGGLGYASNRLLPGLPFPADHTHESNDEESADVISVDFSRQGRNDRQIDKTEEENTNFTTNGHEQPPKNDNNDDVNNNEQDSTSADKLESTLDRAVIDTKENVVSDERSYENIAAMIGDSMHDNDDDEMSSISSRSVAFRRTSSQSSYHSSDGSVIEGVDDNDNLSDADYEDEDYDSFADNRRNDMRRTKQAEVSGRNVVDIATGHIEDDDYEAPSSLRGMIVTIPTVLEWDKSFGSDDLPRKQFVQSQNQNDGTGIQIDTDGTDDLLDQMTDGSLKQDLKDFENKLVSPKFDKTSPRKSSITQSPTLLSPESRTKTFLPIPFQSYHMHEVGDGVSKKQKEGDFYRDEIESCYTFNDDQSLTVASEPTVYQTGRIFEPSPLFASNTEKIAPLLDKSDLPSRRSKKSRRRRAQNNDQQDQLVIGTEGLTNSLAAFLSDEQNIQTGSSSSIQTDLSQQMNGIDSNHKRREEDIVATGLESDTRQSTDSLSNDDDCSVFSEDSRDSIADLDVKRTSRKKKKKNSGKKQKKKIRPKKRGRKTDFQSLEEDDNLNSSLSHTTFAKFDINDRIDAIFNNRESLYAEIDNRQAIWKAILKLDEQSESGKVKSIFVKSKAHTQSRTGRAKSRSPSRIGRTSRSPSRSKHGHSSNHGRSRSKSRDRLRPRSKSRDRLRSRSKSRDRNGEVKEPPATKRGKKPLQEFQHERRAKNDQTVDVVSADNEVRSRSRKPSDQKHGTVTESPSPQSVKETLLVRALKRGTKGLRRKESISSEPNPRSFEDQDPKMPIGSSHEKALRSSNISEKKKTSGVRRLSSKTKTDLSSPQSKRSIVGTTSSSGRKTRSPRTPSSPSSSPATEKVENAIKLKNLHRAVSDPPINSPEQPLEGSKQLLKKKSKTSSRQEKKDSGGAAQIGRRKISSTANASKSSSPTDKVDADNGDGDNNARRKQRLFPSSKNGVSKDASPQPIKSTDKRKNLRRQLADVKQQLETIQSSTKDDVLMMKQDYDHQRLTLIGQLGEIGVEDNPIEALQFLNNTRVVSLHSEGRELRKEIRRLERDISDQVEQTERLILESQSINRDTEAVLQEISREERVNARHTSKLERLRKEHDSLSTVLRTGDGRSREEEDHNFVANLVPSSLRDKEYVELEKKLRRR